MQTTLLGLAIAFIIALVAALIGPYFIDWNQFRPQFEAEATKVIGAPVRVAGELEARLLPSPSLRLRSVVVGGANDLGKVRADKLDVEFSLGSLMRGEWRATELTINGMALDLGLDPQGRIGAVGCEAEVTRRSTGHGGRGGEGRGAHPGVLGATGWIRYPCGGAGNPTTVAAKARPGRCPFLKEMAGDKYGKNVVLMAYSEFGRRVKANGAGGTDHGTAGPVFVAGGPVKGGFYGDEPSLTDLDNGDLKATTDFRDVYYELLARTLKTDPAPSVGTGRQSLGFLV